jgi:hypothetical protein
MINTGRLLSGTFPVLVWCNKAAAPPTFTSICIGRVDFVALCNLIWRLLETPNSNTRRLGRRQFIDVTFVKLCIR